MAAACCRCPDWLTVTTTDLPSEREVQPWFDAVCALWDDAALYRTIGERARQIAIERYGEPVSRKRHVEYFESLGHEQGPLPLRCQFGRG